MFSKPKLSSQKFIYALLLCLIIFFSGVIFTPLFYKSGSLADLLRRFTRIANPVVVGLPGARAEVISTSVTITVCGNNTVESGEECDDGNIISGDGCSSTCQTEGGGGVAVCGNGVKESSEGCDDGNTISGDGCDSSCAREEGGGGGGEAAPPIVPTVTILVLQGKAYPFSSVVILKDGQIFTTAKADEQANFKAEITDIAAGAYTFGAWAEDKDGIRSITFNFTVDVTASRKTIVSGIFIPPTISLNKNKFEPRELLSAGGYTAPFSSLDVQFDSKVYNARADSQGKWTLTLNTAVIGEGVYNIRAKAISTEGLLSTFSNILPFSVGKIIAPPPVSKVCPQADLNKDSKTDLVDFSILLYWWGQSNPCVDQNSDGTADIKDFSIMMYWWTG